MSSVSAPPTGSSLVVRLPVARLKALTRAALWGIAFLILGAGAYLIYGGLSFRPTAVSNRIVDYSIAVVAAPIVVAAALCALRSLRWALLWAWPGQTEIRAAPDSLDLRLGSFGCWRFDVARLEVRYPFELPEDGDFEAFLPEAEQRESLIPRLLHPESPEPIGRTILRFVAGTEPEVAGTLRAAVDQWRAAHDQQRATQRTE